ncbi:MAG TPA: aminoglycoside phosphotransferase family protein [Allosphingosinicella sp.]|jgi:hypothetical protein
MLSRWGAIHHLLRLGLLTPEDLVDGDLVAAEAVSRNRMVRIEPAAGPAFAIKQPKDAAQPDAATMWTEAAIFWLAANDPQFAPLAKWMPRFFHYDEPQKVLTIEFLRPAASLAEKMFGAGVPPRLAADAGRAFALLHGAVSLASIGAPSRRLFSALVPWALTLGLTDNRYFAPTQAAATVLREVMGRPGVAAGIARLRSGWRTERIVHGDAKAANLLIVGDGSVRVIDWEIAGLGEPLWDVGGVVHSLLVPNPGAAVEALEAAQARARPLVEAFWEGYRSGGPAVAPAGPGDPRETVLRMAGLRIVQTSLESAHYGTISPGIAGMIDMAAELIVRPEAAKERWQWAG